MSSINITLDTNTLKAVAKKALIALGVVTLGTAGLATASVAQSVLEVRNNYDIVDLEVDGQWIGNFDCEAGTYRAPFGNSLGLNPFIRYEGEEFGEKLMEQGLGTALVGGLGVGLAAIQACASRPAPEAAPAPVAPAPVAPPVVAPAPQAQTYTGEVFFNGTPETATITRFNGNSYRVTWTDGHEVTYTLENESQVKVSFVSRGAQTEVWGTYRSFNGNAIEVTTENGTTTIPMA